MRAANSRQRYSFRIPPLVVQIKMSFLVLFHKSLPFFLPVAYTTTAYNVGVANAYGCLGLNKHEAKLFNSQVFLSTVNQRAIYNKEVRFSINPQHSS